MMVEPQQGLLRELNPGPLAPEARIMPLDQAATCFKTMVYCIRHSARAATAAMAAGPAAATANNHILHGSCRPPPPPKKKKRLSHPRAIFSLPKHGRRGANLAPRQSLSPPHPSWGYACFTLSQWLHKNPPGMKDCGLCRMCPSKYQEKK